MSEAEGVLGVNRDNTAAHAVTLVSQHQLSLGKKAFGTQDFLSTS